MEEGKGAAANKPLQHRVGKKKGGPPPGPASAEPSILREGEADILLHGNDVFYNKAQIVNRDMSIAVLRAFAAKRQEEHEESLLKKSSKKKVPNGKENGPSTAAAAEGAPGASPVVEDPVSEEKPECSPPAEEAAAATAPVEAAVESKIAKPLHVLEALAASGLRALRYAKEVEQVGSVVACDNDKVAVEACERNIRLNGKVAVAKVTANHADSRIYMLSHEKEFDVVDLDPYGSPSIFLDSAVQSLSEGGLLSCTATDMAVLCGNNGEVCYSKYGAYPLRGKYCHEMALRILLASIEAHANRYKRHIVPVLSLSVDFYVRVFVRIYTSASAIKESPSKLSYVYQCVGCDTYHLQSVGRVATRQGSTRYMPGTGPVIAPDCKQCGKHHNMGGPIWSAPIHDADWVDGMLKSVTAMKSRYPAYNKIHSILTAVSEELNDVPLYISLHSMSATLKCTPPSATLFRSAVVNAGYRISGSHANPLGLKTDAPMEVLWDIMRCWVKDHPVKENAAETPGKVILSKEPEIEANFKKVQSATSKALASGVARFLPNPEEFWGPKPRAGRHLTQKHIASHGAEFVNGTRRAEGQAPIEVTEAPEAKRQKVDE
jgi:tRNA (guanine26-N2/guanine27-N2)-dimethyltransferase